jgi:predicted outer membrane repeat protein
VVSRSTFTNNDATYSGGAISTTTATVTDSTFTHNHAGDDGGAIWANTAATIARSRFTRNTAGGHGGAVILWSPNSDDLQQLRRNTFTRNRAGVGGAITLGPCTVPSRSEAARVERANRFSGNRATEQRRTNNIERFDNGGCTGG